MDWSWNTKKPKGLSCNFQGEEKEKKNRSLPMSN